MASMFLVVALLCVAFRVQAQPGDEIQLRNVLQEGGSLVLKKDILLSQDLPVIPDGRTVTISGALNGGKKPVKIDGQRIWKIFRSSGAVTLSLSNLIITRVAVPAGQGIQAAVDVNGVLTVSNVIFQNNARAIHARSTIGTVSKSKFLDNFKTAVYILPTSSFTITASEFTKNKAASADALDGGAAIHVDSGYDASASVVVSKTTFKGNSAQGSSGGAVYLTTLATGKFTDCSFTGNSAPEGGAIRAGNAYLTTINCKFTGNTADDGGAVFMRSDGEGTFSHFKASFTGNKAANTGGAFVLRQEATADFCSCIFKSNTAKGVANNGHGAIQDAPRIGVLPATAIIKDVTVDPGRDPAEFVAGSCTTK